MILLLLEPNDPVMFDISPEPVITRVPSLSSVHLTLSFSLSLAMISGASSATAYGNYYAWGETTTESTYNWSNYKWSVSGSSVSFSKYTIDTKTTLDPDDDAATQNWGGAWRMPTHAEQEELMNNCSWQWVKSYNNVNVSGYVVAGSNGNSIFLPAAGYRSSISLYDAGWYAYYWSSSLTDDRSYNAWNMYFSSSSHYSRSNDGRYKGNPIRAVCE